MSHVHFVPCVSDEDPGRIGALAAAVAAEALAGDPGPQPGRRMLDRPRRAAAAEAFEAWTGVLDATLPSDGEGLLLATVGTLHPRSGWEGAVHALGILGSSPEEIATLQQGVQPHVDRDVCGGCGICVTLCQREGIRHNGHVAVVRPENCLGCGDCLAECYLEALQFPVGGSRLLMERVAGAAAEASGKAPGVLAVLFLLRSPTRRTIQSADRLPQADLGILAGRDPVAVDRAAAELISEAAGRSLTEISACPEDPLLLLAEAERLGVGTPGHQLVRHDPARLGC